MKILLATSVNHVSTFQIGTATYAGTSSGLGLSIINITDINSPSLVSTVHNASHMMALGMWDHTTFVLVDGSTYALSAYTLAIRYDTVDHKR